MGRQSVRMDHRIQSCETMKRCSTCKIDHPVSFFYKDKRTPSGLKTQCKKCHIEGSIRTRDDGNARSLNREYMARARGKNPEKFRKREREYSLNRPKDEKTKARATLNNARRSGKIKKPLVCEMCDEPKTITGHHRDYSKPLEVTWLCYQCHADVHRVGSG